MLGADAWIRVGLGQVIDDLTNLGHGLPLVLALGHGGGGGLHLHLQILLEQLDRLLRLAEVAERLLGGDAPGEHGGDADGVVDPAAAAESVLQEEEV